jgi:hypothetical protein
VSSADTVLGDLGTDVLTYNDLTSTSGYELDNAYDIERVVVSGDNINLVITDTLFSDTLSTVPGSNATIDASAATGNSYIDASIETASGIQIVTADGNDTIRGGIGNDWGSWFRLHRGRSRRRLVRGGHHRCNRT